MIDQYDKRVYSMIQVYRYLLKLAFQYYGTIHFDNSSELLYLAPPEIMMFMYCNLFSYDAFFQTDPYDKKQKIRNRSLTR